VYVTMLEHTELLYWPYL